MCIRLDGIRMFKTENNNEDERQFVHKVNNNRSDVTFESYVNSYSVYSVEAYWISDAYTSVLNNVLRVIYYYAYVRNETMCVFFVNIFMVIISIISCFYPGNLSTNTSSRIRKNITSDRSKDIKCSVSDHYAHKRARYFRTVLTLNAIYSKCPVYIII